MIDSYSQLTRSIFTSVKSIFPDNKVIEGNQSGNEPQNPYVSFQIVRDVPLGMTSGRGLLGSDNSIPVISNWEALIQFSFVSKDFGVAGNMAKTFVHMLNAPNTLEIFRKNKLCKTTTSPIRNLPVKRDLDWIHYFNVDVAFIYAVETREELIPMTVVEITNQISGTVFTVPPEVVIPD